MFVFVYGIGCAIVFGCVVFTLILSVQLFGAMTEAAMLDNVKNKGTKSFGWANIV